MFHMQEDLVSILGTSNKKKKINYYSFTKEIQQLAGIISGSRVATVAKPTIIFWRLGQKEKNKFRT